MSVRDWRPAPVLAAIVLLSTALCLAGSAILRNARHHATLRVLAQGDTLYALAGDAAGRVYVGGYDTLFAYDPMRGAVEPLSHPFPSNTLFGSLAGGGDGRLYGLATTEKTQDIHVGRLLSDTFFVYDSHLKAVHPINGAYVWGATSLVAGADGRIYRFGERYNPSVYEPANAAELARLKWLEGPQDPFVTWEVYRDGDSISAAGGWLYTPLGLYARVPEPYATSIEPRERQASVLAGWKLVETARGYTGAVITHELPGPAQALAPRPGGGVYLGIRDGLSEGSLWSFDPTNRALAPLPLPPGIMPFAAQALTTSGDGRLYGIGLRQLPSRAIESFLFVYTPGAATFEQIAVWPGWSRGALLAMPGSRVYVLWQDQLLLYEP